MFTAPEIMEFEEECVTTNRNVDNEKISFDSASEKFTNTQSAEQFEQNDQIYQDIKAAIEDSITEESTAAIQIIEQKVEPIVQEQKVIKETTSETFSMSKINDTVVSPPIKLEPAVESLSVKIEQIAIDAKPQQNIPIEQNNDIKEIVSKVSRLDVKKLEIKADELKIKTDEDQLKKDTETESALTECSKEMIVETEDTSIRRSGRIRTIKQTKQRSQGFGLVKEKKRAPIVVDEDSSNASFEVSNDFIADKDVASPNTEPKIRIKTDEELEKEKIDRENGMKLFASIIDNEYRSERIISKEAKKMTCDCFLTQSEIERGEMGCGDDCLNRMLLIECGPKCIVGERCTNHRFQKHENSACNIFKTEKKGYGLIATSFIPAGQFIMEYVGEVLNSKQFEKRANDYSKQMNAHYYFMALSSDCVIDATKKGNISRFINHSCDPNAETQKWTVNGELRIGFFSKKPIMPDDEITFDYQFQRYG